MTLQTSLPLRGFRHMAPAFQFQQPKGFVRAQRGKPLRYLHISIAFQYIPHYDPETKELIKVEVQIQNKGTTYRSLERARKQLNRREYFDGLRAG